MTGTRHELLTSRLGPDERWHAHYPTALRTLCGELLSERPVVGRRYEPTCEECVRQAWVLQRIEQSMPKHWSLPLPTRVAA